MSFDIAHSELPPQIRIGPFPHNVVFTENASAEDEKCFGTYDWNNLELAFEPTQTNKEFAVDVVLHEIMHGLWKIGGLGVKQKLNEEKVITVLATGMLQVLKDNPLLMAWLVRQLKT